MKNLKEALLEAGYHLRELCTLVEPREQQTTSDEHYIHHACTIGPLLGHSTAGRPIIVREGDQKDVQVFVPLLSDKSFPEQMAALTRWLQDNGVPPQPLQPPGQP